MNTKLPFRSKYDTLRKMKYIDKNYIRYGMLMVVITIGCLAAMEISGQNKSYDINSPLFFIYQWVAPLTVWYFGIRAKKKQLKNKLTFKQGFVEGMKMAFVFAFVSPFVFLAYYTLVNPEIVNWLRHGSNDPTWLVIGRDMLAQVVASIVFGVIHTTIVTFILKTRKK